MSAAILGVEVKELKSFPDRRGFFREVIRCTDDSFDGPFAQWSHSKMGKNTVKAWHFHHKQTDWWYLAIGIVDAVLFDYREESPTFKTKLELTLGDPELDDRAKVAVVKIPPGVLHGLKVQSSEAHLFYVTNELYDAKDEGRYPFNSDIVPHSWGDERELTIADNDRKMISPPFPRVRAA